MDNKLFFIIGMRRSGTSILRTILRSYKEIKDILFEPHELYWSISVQGMKRYQRGYCKEIINELRDQGNTKWYGAKFALNIGFYAMEWKMLPKIFPKAKLIFIERNNVDTYRSWVKLDKEHYRGIVQYQMYEPWAEHIKESFKIFCRQNPNQSCIISYDNLIKDPNKEIQKVEMLLNLEHKDVTSLIHKPENWNVK